MLESVDPSVRVTAAPDAPVSVAVWLPAVLLAKSPTKMLRPSSLTRLRVAPLEVAVTPLAAELALIASASDDRSETSVTSTLTLAL